MKKERLLTCIYAKLLWMLINWNIITETSNQLFELKKEAEEIIKDTRLVLQTAIDQGGSTETSRPTTHDDPVYVIDGVVHYCVTNMPGAVARTSTYALSNATFPYILKVANDGFKKWVRDSIEIRTALNMTEGHLTIKEVAETFDIPYKKYA